MDVRAAVAWEAGQPLVVETVQLDGPKAGEVLIEIKATGICHTDEFTRSGADPEGLFPVIFGHEGAGIVVEAGPGVKSLKKGDHVIPLYTPECRECKSCLSRKTNLCTAIRGTQGQGVMPDGTSRFSINGRKIHHYMGCSTFSNFTVLPEIAVAKIREDAPFDKVCYIGCGVTTGVGAVAFTMKVEPGSTVAVFGLGGIGLNVIQGAKMVGASRIIGVDLNPAKVGLARRFGMIEAVAGGQDHGGALHQQVVHGIVLQPLLSHLAVGEIRQRAGQPVRRLCFVAHCQPARQHPAVTTIPAHHAVLVDKMRRASRQVVGQILLKLSQVIRVRAPQPLIRAFTDVLFCIAQHRFPARRIIHRVVGQVPIPYPVVGAARRQRKTLFTGAQGL